MISLFCNRSRNYFYYNDHYIGEILDFAKENANVVAGIYIKHSLKH